MKIKVEVKIVVNFGNDKGDGEILKEEKRGEKDERKEKREKRKEREKGEGRKGLVRDERRKSIQW